MRGCVVCRRAHGWDRAQLAEVRVLRPTFRREPAKTFSHAWRHDQAEATITGEGRTTEDVFDCGQSRQLSRHLRPEAARLVEAIKDPGRGFDAIVIGSYEVRSMAIRRG
jgi:hypothetical protein